LSSRTLSANETIRNGIRCIKRRGKIRTVIPQPLIPTLLTRHHDENGHPGMNKLLKTITSLCWWSTMTSDIRDYIKTCHTCQMVKPTSHAPYGPLMPLESPAKP